MQVPTQGSRLLSAASPAFGPGSVRPLRSGPGALRCRALGISRVCIHEMFHGIQGRYMYDKNGDGVYE